MRTTLLVTTALGLQRHWANDVRAVVAIAVKNQQGDAKSSRGVHQNTYTSGPEMTFTHVRSTTKEYGMQACSKITGILPGSPPEGQNWSSTRHLRFAPKTIQCEVEGETIAHQCPLLLFTDKQRSRATNLCFATEDFMPAIPHAMVYVLQQRFLHWVPCSPRLIAF